MAPRHQNIDRSKVPEEMMKKAREAALAKQARMMAEQELGISDTDLPVQRGPLGDEGELTQIYINLAEFVDRIVIDDVTYMNGRTYNLPLKKVQAIKEQLARTWRHQAEIEGKDHSNFYLQQQVQNARPVNVNHSAPGRLVRA